MEYSQENINVKLTIRKMPYKNFHPVDPAQAQKLFDDFKDRPVFDVWEMCIPQGEGWLGVHDSEGETLIEGEFMTYLHKGSYTELLEAGKQIGSTPPNMKEFYFVYLNSPREVAEADLRTKIVFRE